MLSVSEKKKNLEPKNLLEQKRKQLLYLNTPKFELLWRKELTNRKLSQTSMTSYSLLSDQWWRK